MADPEPGSDLTAVNAETRDLSSYVRLAPIPDNDAPAGSRADAVSANGSDAVSANGSGASPDGANPRGSRATRTGPASGKPANAAGTDTASTTAATTSQSRPDDQDTGATQPRPAVAAALPGQHDQNGEDARDHQDADPERATAADNTAPKIAAPPR